MFLNIIATLSTFLFMEFVAWFAHKYVMHGFLWILHKDHHQKEPGFFERNDSFFLIFAIPSAYCFVTGSIYNDVRFYIGLGILLYGICYFIVHDVIIHQRFKWFRDWDNTYVRGIRRAHKMHHKHLGKEEGENFGMLVVPFRYFLEQRKTNS
jgi:beta-carotene 3-hydroxylase